MIEAFDIAVVGGGVSGLAAACQAAGEGSSVVHLSGAALPGGLITNVGELVGYPFGPQPVSGVGLVETLGAAGAATGVASRPVDIDGVKASADGFMLTSGASSWRARRLIAATGARLRPLEVEGAERFRDRGVLQCAWCNAGLYRGKSVVVVGGGDSALQEALHLAGFAAKVTLVVRGEAMRARQSFVLQAADQEKIEFRWNADVLSIQGGEALTSVSLRLRDEDRQESVECDAVFPYIGLLPNSGLLAELADLDPEGFVMTDAGLETRTPGLYAIGAVRRGYAGRITCAVGEATAAAIAANRGLQH
jgi:thioredoxin reductase (NADPH)